VTSLLPLRHHQQLLLRYLQVRIRTLKQFSLNRPNSYCNNEYTFSIFICDNISNSSMIKIKAFSRLENETSSPFIVTLSWQLEKFPGGISRGGGVSRGEYQGQTAFDQLYYLAQAAELKKSSCSLYFCFSLILFSILYYVCMIHFLFTKSLHFVSVALMYNLFVIQTKYVITT